MSHQNQLSRWMQEVSSRMPHLSKPQATVLALLSFGMVVVQSSGISRLSLFLALLLDEQENTLRQRLREWYYDAPDKRGQQRQQVDVTTCFAPLLRWVLANWSPTDRRLALALDASTLRQVFTVLSVSVMYRGCAIPVAWVVLPACEPGAWQPHWRRLLAALHGVIGVLMALHHRTTNGGKGQVVDVALYEAVFNMMESTLPEYDMFGIVRERTGSNLTGIVPSNTYLTREGHHVVIGANADSIFKRLMSAIGRPDLANDPALADNTGRAARADELDRVIGAWTGQNDAETVLRVLAEAQVPSGKIYSIADIVKDPQYLARDMIRQLKLANGADLKVPGIVPKLSDTPGDIEWAGPALGEHTAEVLARLGYTDVEIAALRERGAI